MEARNSFTAIVLAGALVAWAGAAAAETIELDVAGQHVRLVVAETDAHEVSSETPTSTYAYRHDDVTSGAHVNGEGASVTARRIAIESAYDGPAGTTSQSVLGVGAIAHANAAGFDVEERGYAWHYDSQYDFGPLNHAHGHNVLVTHYGNAWGNGMQLWGNNALNVGAGHLESAYLNPDPVVGVIGFAGAAAYGQNNGYAGPVAWGAYGGPSVTVFAGDYTGSDAGATAQVARCFQGACQWDYAGASLCVAGVRLPFFVHCLLS